MAASPSSPPVGNSEFDKGKGRMDDPTPGPVSSVCRCSFCEDARKGPIDTKRFFEVEKGLWSDRYASRKFSWRDEENWDNWTAPQWAAAGGHDGVVQFFLDVDSAPSGMVKGRDRKPNVMLTGHDGLSALHLAARGGHTNIVLALLNGGARACVHEQARVYFHYTALHLASQEGHIDVVQVLLNNDPKAEVNVVGKDGNTPLHLACEGGYFDVAQVLLNNDPKAEVNVVRWDENTPLHLACEGGYIDVVQALLNNDPKAEVNVAGEDGNTPLYFACLGGYIDVVQALLNNDPKAEVNVAGGYRNTPLCLACEGGYIDVVQVLLNNDPKAEVNVNGWEGTPLHLACKGGYIDVVQALLNNDPKAEVNVEGRKRRTPLHLACKGGHIDVVQALLKSDPKAEVNVVGWEENTPLHLACEGGHIDVVQALLNNDPKAEVNVEGRKRNTPLYLACKGGHIDVVQALLKNDPKAEVNVVGWDGNTPLHLACEGGHIDVVKALLDAHSKPHLNVRGSSGETTVDFINRMHEKYANNKSQEIVKQFASIISKHIGEKSYKSAARMAYESSEGPIWQELIQKDPIKNYLEVLCRDRQAYVDAANAILVGAALIASVTFGSWLQPPLNYTIAGDVYASSQSSGNMSPSSSYDPNYVDLEHNMSLRVFWVVNCLSFYFAIATVVFGACSVLPRKRLFIQQTVVELRRNLLVTSIFLGCSVLFVTIAFGIAGCIVLAPIIKFQLYMIVPTCIGGPVCLFSLYVLFKNIVEDLSNRWVEKTSPNKHRNYIACKGEDVEAVDLYLLILGIDGRALIYSLLQVQDFLKLIPNKTRTYCY